jgi:hypothetical protein
MTRVLVHTDDAAVRDVDGFYLRSEGHIVLSTSDNDHALTVLRVSRHPIVVFVHAGRTSPEVFDFLQRVTEDGTGPLARHRYIIALARPDALQPAQRRLVSRLGAHVVALPYELEDMAAAVDCAQREL